MTCAGVVWVLFIWLITHSSVFFAVLFVLSEALGISRRFKPNSVTGLMIAAMKELYYYTHKEKK